ncbi:MAG: STAS domain-containing protein [Streptosporangiaceae bacterium]
MPSLSVEFGRRDGTVTVVLYGELDVATAPALVARLEQLPDPQPEQLIFELAGLTFTDCTGARAIAGAGQGRPGSGRPGSGPPVLRHVRPAVRRVLDLTGLGDLCQLEPD